MIHIDNTEDRVFSLSPSQVDDVDIHNDMLFMFIEKHGDNLFAYMNKSKTYISHGKTMDDIFARMYERFPSLIPVIMNDPDEDWIWEGSA